MHTRKKIGTKAPSHSLTINTNGNSFHIGDTAVWYGQIPNVIARMNPVIEKGEICYYLSWCKSIDGTTSSKAIIVNEFIRTVEYQTAMISKYKHKHTVKVEEDESEYTYLVTFVPTSCY